MADGDAAIAATEAAAEATAAVVETVADEKQIALENAQVRIDEAQALARQITDAALASELGKQIEGLRAQCQQMMESLRAEMQAGLAEIRGMATQRPDPVSPSVVVVPSPSTPEPSDPTQPQETPPPTVAVVTPGNESAVVLPVPPIVPAPRKRRVI